MNEFIEKLIGRLEEKKSDLTTWAEDKAFEIGIETAISIVNQLAEEYKQNTDHDLMIVESLSSVYQLQPFEVEAIDRVVSSAKHSGGWISCSADMPDHDQEVFIKFSDGAICNGRFWIAEGTNYCGFNTRFGLFIAEQVAEWKPVAPYQPKGE